MSDHRSKYSLPPVLGSTPWLILSHGRHKQIKTFFNPVDGSIHHRNIPEMRRKSCLGCSHGWSMMVDESLTECCLFNLATMEVITLPLPSVPLDSLTHFVLSSPTDAPACTIAILADHQTFVMLCRLQDKKWSKQEIDLEGDEYRYYSSIVSCKGKIYLYTASDKLVVLDVESDAVRVQKMDVEEPVSISSSGLYYRQQLIAFGEDIFYVFMYYRRHIGFVVNAEVFKLDPSKLVWERLKSIGEDRAIIWGDFGTSCMVTEPRLKGDCIYFVQSHCDGMRWCRYNLDERIISHKLVCPNLCRTNQRVYLATTMI